MLRSVDSLALLVEVTLSQGFNLRVSPPVACQLLGDLALRLDFHQQAVPSLAGHANKKAAHSLL
ncbi:hypothetical protein BJR07_04325 [Bacillus cereus]|uniref:Uncharacterized protein n=1 Tax=Bacillus cereus TaxID=1396 RepID=A0A1Q4LG76_BACCE|nr:hypothetical protein BJR06_14495 [Bacillus cereus]OKA41147.1 hypothetical protein BJR07_04325 [Bacillus cereus]